MEFAHPQWLALLILVPLLGVWEWWRARRKAGLRFSNVAAAKAAPRTLWTYLGGMPALLRMAALTLGLLALDVLAPAAGVDALLSRRPARGDVDREDRARDLQEVPELALLERLEVHDTLDTALARLKALDPQRFR